MTSYSQIIRGVLSDLLGRMICRLCTTPVLMCLCLMLVIVTEYKELCCLAAGVNDLLRQVSTTAVKQEEEEEEGLLVGV